MNMMPDNIGVFVADTGKALLYRIDEIIEGAYDGTKQGILRTAPFKPNWEVVATETVFIAICALLTAIKQSIDGYMGDYHQDQCIQRLKTFESVAFALDRDELGDRFDEYMNAKPDSPGIELTRFIEHCSGNSANAAERRFYTTLYEECFDRPMRVTSASIRSCLREAWGTSFLLHKD